jgi:esterase/lipase superfamily enzyme
MSSRIIRSFNYLAGMAVLAGFIFSPARAGERAAVGPELPFHTVTLGDDGTADESSLEAMTRSLREEARDARAQIVVMVHGFDTNREDATSDYTSIARRLRSEAKSAGLQVAPVGVYWNSDAGSMGKWLPKAIGQRVTSLLGFRKAVHNPYLEKARLARQTGRSGLRAVFFRLQEQFPAVPVHVFSHSLGAEVTISALAPETADEQVLSTCEQPRRPLEVGIVTLAGADVDYDLFARKSQKQACAALERARVWWVTVPEKKQADGVLEFRLGAGRGHAVGNRGLKLAQPELDSLLSRRALVVDQGEVPVRHAFTDY